MSIVNSVNKVAGKAFNKVANTNYIKRNLALGVADPAKFKGRMLVTSILTKDAIGCYLYTSQSLHNEKIPKENRGFVAAIDFVNGLLMVGGQFLVGQVIDAKLTPCLKNKANEKYFNADQFKKVAEDAYKSSSETIAKLGSAVDDKTKEKVIKGVVNNLKKNRMNPYITGLSLATSALMTTALVKRTIVPLISTPLAGKLTEVLEKKSAQKAENK